jgi:glucosyltransferase
MEPTKKLLSIIVPCYNEEASIHPFFKELSNVINTINLDVEIIFVDDGSVDRTVDLLKELYFHNKTLIKLITFSRNFGKESAMYAGLEKSIGDYVVIMDADLQDPPSLLPDMIEHICVDHYDVVATRRKDRKGESALKSFFSVIFYKLINKISDIKIVNGARDYRMMTRQVVKAILQMSENNRFSKGITEWVGFKTKYIEFENICRDGGKSSFGVSKLFRYAIDGIVSFSTVPLRLASITGIVISLLSFIYLIFIVIKTILFGDPVAGYPSMTAIILFSAGVQLLFLGVIGEYVGKIFIEAKNRPKYIVKSVFDNTDEK